MAKSTKIEPSGTETLSGKQVLDVCLVVEEPETGEPASVLKRLRKWIQPESARINLILAVPEVVDSKWFFSEARIYLETIVERQREVQERADLLSDMLLREGFKVTEDATGVMSDKGTRQIVEDLTNSPADLLVVLSGHDSSFAHRLVTHAPCSTLLLRGKDPTPSPTAGPRILMGIDGTESSNLALEKLPDLIRIRPLQADLVTIENMAYFENGLAAPFVNITAMEEAMRENAAMILQIGRGILSARGIDVVEDLVVTGPPAWELVTLAKNRHPDLVVVGSHNRTGIPAWLLGSVSWRMVQSDTHNLLVVR